MVEHRRPDEPRQPAPGQKPEGSRDEDRQKKRERARALIIGSLTAGGMFQLNGWQAQAHGNRSSHSVAAFQSALYRPEDYVLMREESLAPRAKDTLSLAQANAKFRTLLKKGPAALKTAEFTELVDIRIELEKKLQLGSANRPARPFLQDGDIPGAIAAIEGVGAPQGVLDEYLWTLLDIAYVARDGETFNASRLSDFVAISRAAMTFIDKASAGLQPPGASTIDDALRVKTAEVLHNIASFTLPDEGDVPDETLKLGRSAADKALAIRVTLKQDPETMIALWMVGKHQLRVKDFANAIASFQRSIEIATRINSADGLAWGKTYLAKAIRAASPEDETTFKPAEEEARRVLEQQTQSSILIDLLRIDQKLPD